MWINYVHQLAARLFKSKLESLGVWEFFQVPCEVTFAISVFDIKPDYITRYLESIKIIIYIQQVFSAFVIPSALVITKSP